VLRKCRKCGTEFDQKKCPECSRVRSREYAKNNKDKIKSYQEEYRLNHKKEASNYSKEYRELNKDEIIDKKHKYYYKNKVAIAKKQKAYYKTDNGKANASSSNRRSKIKYPEKTKARSMLNHAVSDGNVEKLKICELCGASGCRLQGHHYDYSKPLDVIWCCCLCHSAIHHDRQIKEQV